jgi:hypothetical protein
MLKRARTVAAPSSSRYYSGSLMHRKRLAFAAFAIALCSAGMANAANVTSINPQSVVLALQNNGYKAVLDKTSEGDPLIKTGADGNTIIIVMTDCLNHKSCTTTEFVGLWDCSKSVENCKKVSNEFNSQESPVHALTSKDGKAASTYSYLVYDEIGISLFIKNLTIFNHYNNQFTLDVAKK